MCGWFLIIPQSPFHLAHCIESLANLSVLAHESGIGYVPEEAKELHKKDVIFSLKWNVIADKSFYGHKEIMINCKSGIVSFFYTWQFNYLTY